MGIKGDKATKKGTDFCEEIMPRLSTLRKVTSKKQFGGYGIFKDRMMFGIISSKAELFFKTDDATISPYHKVKSPQHGKMPYYRVPTFVLADDEKLIQWAREAINVAKRQKARLKR